MNHDRYDDAYLRDILTRTKTIALVGASPRPDRPSHRVMKFLQGRGFRVIHRPVYEVLAVPALPDAAQAALAAGDITAALFFSTESARQCVRLLQAAHMHEAVSTVDALAIGQAAAVALDVLPWRRISVASRPTQDAMLALLP